MPYDCACSAPFQGNPGQSGTRTPVLGPVFSEGPSVLGKSANPHNLSLPSTQLRRPKNSLLMFCMGKRRPRVSIRAGTQWGTVTLCQVMVMWRGNTTTAGNLSPSERCPQVGGKR